MKKLWYSLVPILAFTLFLSGCGQEKVIDTDFIRLQNNVKDLQTTQKQKSDDLARLNQKVSDLQTALDQQKGQLQSLLSSAKEGRLEEIHPVVIRDVKITSDKMDSNGRVFGPFNINVTLYNGTDADVSDKIMAMVLMEHHDGASQDPQIQNLIQSFDIKSKESKTITFTNIPIDNPAKRLNVVLKLLESSPSPTTAGIPGKATWVIVPTVIFPPSQS
jgi:soluble cytochrome b562